MRTYQLVDIWFDGYFLYLLPSHEVVAKALQAAVREKISGANLKLTDDYYMFEHLNGKDRSMLAWCMAWLGENGFQPYATSLHDKVSGYCFRRAAENPTQQTPSVNPFAR